VPEQRGSAAGLDHNDGRDQRQAGQHGDGQPTASGLPGAGHGPGDGLADDGERHDVRRTRHGARPAGTSGREGADDGDQEQQLQDPDEVDRGQHQAAEELGTGAYREGDQLVGRDDLVAAAGGERGDDGEHTEAQEGLRGKLADGRQRRGRQRARAPAGEYEQLDQRQGAEADRQLYSGRTDHAPAQGQQAPQLCRRARNADGGHRTRARRATAVRTGARRAAWVGGHVISAR